MSFRNNRRLMTELGESKVTDRSQAAGRPPEAKFSRRSHGFRPGRGCASALQAVDRAVKAGYTWVVDADLQAFFDSVDHDRLLEAVHEEVTDGSLLRLLRSIWGWCCTPRRPGS